MKQKILTVMGALVGLAIGAGICFFLLWCGGPEAMQRGQRLQDFVMLCGSLLCCCGMAAGGIVGWFLGERPDV